MQQSKKAAPKAHLNGNGAIASATRSVMASDELAPTSRKKTVPVTKVSPATKGEKRAPSLTRATPRSESDKLVCRYCGSDDLAPSFIKRRDARCRACFKQRYGSAARSKGKTRSAA